MKRIYSIFLLCSMVISLFTGCKNADNMQTHESEAKEAVVTEALEAVEGKSQLSYSIFEEQHPVDDSYTWEYVEKEENGLRGPEKVLKEEILPEYVDKWTENGEILDIELAYMANFQSTWMYGWVLFRGDLRQETGWSTVEYEGSPAYCRSFCMSSEGRDNHIFDCNRSQAAIPVPFLTEDLWLEPWTDETINSGLVQTFQFPEITKAELYCRDLQQGFEVSDFGSLSELQRTFSNIQRNGGRWINTYLPHDLKKIDQENPLILTFADGKKTQIFTGGDGSARSNAWQGQEMLNLPMSLYELFSVPLKAAGYERNELGQLEVHCSGSHDRPRIDQSVETTVERLLTYSPEGYLIKMESWERPGIDRDELYQKAEYIYDPEGRLTQMDEYLNGEFKEKTAYFYNSAGNVEKETKTFFDDVSLDTKYHYDDKNRLIAVISYDKNGKEFGPGSQYYYWYDDEGNMYSYQYDQDGSIASGRAPDTPIRKKKD